LQIRVGLSFVPPWLGYWTGSRRSRILISTVQLASAAEPAPTAARADDEGFV